MSIKTAYSRKQALTYDNQRFSDHKGKTIHDIELGMLLAAADTLPKEATLLEVGCGTGRLLSEMCERGYRVDGLDASTDMLSECQRKLANHGFNARLVLAECGMLPFRGGAYDFVYSIRLLNQTESSTYALRSVEEMLRVAKPSAYVLVEFVNYFRPRFPCVTRRTVRLRTREISMCARANGSTLVWTRGAFFFGMTMIHLAPRFLIPWIRAIDRMMSFLLPRLCARCYVLLKK